MQQRIALSVPRDLTVLTCGAEKIKGETESEKRKDGGRKILSQREFACNYLRVVQLRKKI